MGVGNPFGSSLFKHLNDTVLTQTCDIYRINQTPDAEGVVSETPELLESSANCRLINAKEQLTNEATSNTRERMFDLSIKTDLPITSAFYFTNFAGGGIVAPSAKYIVDETTGIDPIKLAGITVITNLTRVDSNE
jgi:hypothetical protein